MSAGVAIWPANWGSAPAAQPENVTYLVERRKKEAIADEAKRLGIPIIKVIFVTDRSTTFVMTEDGDFVCAHESVTIEKACCSPLGRIIECGCGGQDSIICNAADCTGIQDHEVDALFERERGY